MQQSIEHLHAILLQHPELKYELELQEWQTDFLRFYHSQTNYNISKSSIRLNCTIYQGKQNYSFSIDDPNPEEIDQAFSLALAIIGTLPEDPYFEDVETDLTIADVREIPNNIITIPLPRKTQILQELADMASPYDFEIYGTFFCNYSTTRLLNSNGLDKQSSISPIYLEVKAVHNRSQITVMETFGGDDFKYFYQDDFKARLQAKIRYCEAEKADLEPGHYQVVLAPRCVAEFASYLCYGISAHALDERSSFFEGKLNEAVLSPQISITDDPEDPEMIRSDYGSQGHIYRPLSLVENGIFRNFMCSNYYAHKLGLPKNGNTGSCLKIDTGDKSLEELIGSVKRGIYISSLHYMNFINPKETSLTGLTRDGTFLIEDGKIAKVLMSLRFTERLDRIFQHVLALENRAYTIPFSENYQIFDIETVKAPHALVADFNITSSTHTI